MATRPPYSGGGPAGSSAMWWPSSSQPVDPMNPTGLHPFSLLLILACLATGAHTGPLAAQGRVGRWREMSGQPLESRLSVGYAADGFVPVRGGRSGDPTALDNLDLLLHVNLERLLGLSATSVRVHVQSNRGRSVSSEVEDLQGISNLEADPEWRLYEAWVEHQVQIPRISFLAGVRDLNAEFDVTPSAGDFLNGAFSFGPEYSLGGPAGPSTFPVTGLAARLKFEPSPSVYGLLGISDGLPGGGDAPRYRLDPDEGALLSLELGYVRSPSDVTLGSMVERQLEEGRRGRGRALQARRRQRIGRGAPIVSVGTKIALGGWTYSRRFEGWDPDASPSRGWGLYLLGERSLWQDRDGIPELSGFARVGVAGDAADRVDLSVRGGIASLGAFPGRPMDVLGLGVAYARNGTPFLRAQRMAGFPMERSETVLELTYRAEVGSSFVVQPDLQWIRNPGMDPSLGNALVLGLRAHILLDIWGSSSW